MAFTNGQNVQANDLNNLSVTTVTASGDVSVGDDLTVTDDASIGGDLVVTGSLSVGGVPVSSTVTRDLCCGRLSLTTGVSVTTSDVTAATTLYFALHNGNQIALYSGAEWVLFSIAQLSIAVPATTNQMYDVFVDYNAGVPALALTAWTNDTTRATALTTQDGILVKTGSTTHRYVGSFRTTGVSGQTEDSEANRLVFNHQHQELRRLRKVEGANSWTYSAAAFQEANATSNRCAVVTGVAGNPVDLYAQHMAAHVSNQNCWTAIGYDSTTVPIAVSQGCVNISNVAVQLETRITHYPAIGYHYYAWLERATASGATTWYGDNGDATLTQSGLFGFVRM